MNTRIFIGMAVIFTMIYIGCTHHTVKVEQDEPLRVDVNMRIDVYQHVLEQADEIERMVNEGAGQSMLQKVIQLASYLDFASAAYAQESSFSQETMNAIESRKNRRDEIIDWQSRGILGENADGFVEIYSRQGLSSTELDILQTLVSNENADRQTIYENLAQKQGTSAQAVGKVYSIKLQKNAPAGTPIQTVNEATGSKQWEIK